MSPVSLQIEELSGGERKGIGSILDFSTMKTEKRESLRRAFPVDMSCKKWVAQNLHFSPKNIDSNEDFSTMSSSDTSLSSSLSLSTTSEEEQQSKELEDPPSFDIWGSIQPQKTTNLNSLFAPNYIHPLVKQSSSSLSENSLQLCTESLGSETGSNGSPEDPRYFGLDRGDEEEEGDHDHDEEEQAVQDEMQQSQKNQIVVNYNCCVSRKSPTRLFPPPLTSISRRDGPCLRMRRHRRDGRLVIEAIPVPSRRYLQADRQGGRLHLSFIHPPSTKETHIPSQQEQSKIKSKEVQQEEEAVVVVERRIVMEMRKVEEEEAMGVGHPMLVVMRNFMCPNPWMGNEVEGRDEQKSEGLHGCNGFRKGGSMAHPSEEAPPNKLMVSRINKPMVIKGEVLLPHVMRCMEPLPRRPLIVWETNFCIATT